MNKLRSTYQKKEKAYSLSVDYTYIWEDGDHNCKGAHDIDVTEVYIDGYSISLAFYNDYVHDIIEDDIVEHALGNR
tara:strand:- start:150 stop:377 length:228 start_codon:yes stop_codon:yes gene_type:complete